MKLKIGGPGSGSSSTGTTKKGDTEANNKDGAASLKDSAGMEKKVLVELIGGGGIKREMPAFKISESLAGNNSIFNMGGLPACLDLFQPGSLSLLLSPELLLLPLILRS